jgi:hypothetical protein
VPRPSNSSATTGKRSPSAKLHSRAPAEAVYEGELRARPAERGFVLTDLESRPDIEQRLADTLGLDTWHGGARPVRLIVDHASASSDATASEVTD